MDYIAVHLFDSARDISLAVTVQFSVISMYDTPWS